jgi:4-hydroxybenzoate polyprenyltransferase
MLIRELLFKTWYLVLAILVLSFFISTIVNPTAVLVIAIASTLLVLFKVQKGLKGNSDE